MATARLGVWRRADRVRYGVFPESRRPGGLGGLSGRLGAAFDAGGKPIWAEIVIDNQLTGELTPKEIAVRIGQRTIAAKKDGYILVNGEKTVMLEKNLDEPIKFIFKKVL